MQAWRRSALVALFAVLVLACVSALNVGGPTTGGTPAIRSAGNADLTAPSTDTGDSRHSALSRSTGSPRVRPNIVFVMTDDMRDDDLEHMPITRKLLRREGMEFTDAISPHPLCCPARAELVTGQYAQNNGVQHNTGPYGGFQALDHTHEISSWFDRAGYRTALIGKFLNGYGADDPVPAGWERWDALVAGTYNYFNFAFANDGTPQRFRNSYVTDVISQRTNATIKSFARRVEPFVVFSWHLAPHYRIDAGKRRLPPSAPRDRDLFRQITPPSLRNPSFNERRTSDQPRPFRNRRQVNPRAVIDEYQARLRSLQSVDRAVASLVDTLRETGELDHTYIVFTSDNGYSLGEHRYVGKNVLTEEPLQVPLLVRGPGVPAGTTSTLPVSIVDLPATFAAITDATPGWEIDGTSVLDAWHGRDISFRDTTLVQTGTDERDGWAYRGVRTARYLYGVGPSDAFLYDRQLDPDLLVNRANDPAYTLVRAALELRRTALIECSGWRCNQEFGTLPEPSVAPTGDPKARRGSGG